MQSRGQFRLIEVTVVVDPALDVRSEHPRQILQGFVGPMVQRPPSDRLPNRLQRLRTSRWQEGSDIATAMPDRLSRMKGVPEKVKRLNRKVATPVRILTIDELRLRRMKNQPTGPEAALQGIPEPASFVFASAVANNVIRVSFERDGGETPRHPPVKSIVQEQISQDGAVNEYGATGRVLILDKRVRVDSERGRSISAPRHRRCQPRGERAIHVVKQRAPLGSSSFSFPMVPARSSADY